MLTVCKTETETKDDGRCIHSRYTDAIVARRVCRDVHPSLPVAVAVVTPWSRSEPSFRLGEGFYHVFLGGDGFHIMTIRVDPDGEAEFSRTLGTLP